MKKNYYLKSHFLEDIPICLFCNSDVKGSDEKKSVLISHFISEGNDIEDAIHYAYLKNNLCNSCFDKSYTEPYNNLRKKYEKYLKKN